jgi:hypothetical protein
VLCNDTSAHLQCPSRFDQCCEMDIRGKLPCFENVRIRIGWFCGDMKATALSRRGLGMEALNKNIATILKQNVILVTTVHVHVYCLVDNTNKAQNYKDMVQKLLSYSAVFFFLATNVK